MHVSASVGTYAWAQVSEQAQRGFGFPELELQVTALQGTPAVRTGNWTRDHWSSSPAPQSCFLLGLFWVGGHPWEKKLSPAVSTVYSYNSPSPPLPFSFLMVNWVQPREERETGICQWQPLEHLSADRWTLGTVLLDHWERNRCLSDSYHPRHPVRLSWHGYGYWAGLVSDLPLVVEYSKSD